MKEKKNNLKKLSLALIAAVGLLFSVATLASCNNSNAEKTEATTTVNSGDNNPVGTKYVTFMVEENGQWKQYGNKAEIKDGKVSMPKNPEKEYYVFRDWYTDDKFENAFVNEKIENSVTVYALFVAETMNIHINDESKTIDMVNYDVETKNYEDDAKDKNLTFDGWYTDKAYQTKYEAGVDATDIYARYVACITFNNGYEDVYSFNATVNSTIEEPKTDDICKSYMDTEDLKYVDQNGKEFDFNKNITENTTITVVWKTPYLGYQKIEGTNNYNVYGILSEKQEEILNFPVISIPGGETTFNGEIINVVGVDFMGVQYNYGKFYTNIFGFVYYNATKIIVNEGIETIIDLSNNGSPITPTIEEVILPDSLKVMDRCFNGLYSLKELNIPSNVEVIMDSFWFDYQEYIVGQQRDNENYNFDVIIPNSVKTISLVPNGLSFEDESYYYEDNCLFKKSGDDLILLSITQDAVKNGILKIKDGVTKIQVGVLSNFDIDYIELPASFEGINYTVDYNDYKEIYNNKNLTNLDYLSSPTSTNTMSFDAYTIVSNLDELSYVVFNANSYPSGLGENAISNMNEAYTTYESKNSVTKVVFVGEIDNGDATVSVAYWSSADKDNTKEIKDFNIQSGSTLTLDSLLEKIGLDEATLGYKIKTTSVTQFGETYKFGNVNTNLYLELEYDYDFLGFTYELKDGEYVVTGFDINTAGKLADDTYVINIPNEINGKKITSIKNEAFMDENQISMIIVGQNVKTIGAKAFMNMYNLKTFKMFDGSCLEEIGESAFENVGVSETIDADGNVTYTINPNLNYYKFMNNTMPNVNITIPLKNIKSIGAYAFKSLAISGFIPTNDEKDRKITVFGASMGINTYSAGDFVYDINTAGDFVKILKLNSIEKVTVDDREINYHKYSLIAIAAGQYALGSYDVVTGTSMEYYGTMISNDVLINNVVGYSVEEGSIYFENSIFLGLAYHVSKNAITSTKYTVIYAATSGGESKTATKLGCYVENEKDGVIKYNCYIYTNSTSKMTYHKQFVISLDDLKAQNPNIFEDGWYLGLSNSDNKFIESATESSSMLVIG